VPARLNIPNVPPAQFADDSYPYTISLNPIVNMFNSVSSNIKTANKAFYDRIISRLTNIIKDFNGVAQGESLDIEFSENRIRIDQELLELEINNVDDEIYLEQQLRMLASSYGQSLDSYSEPVRQFITSLETLKDRIESL
jgi:hypothetical protein